LFQIIVLQIDYPVNIFPQKPSGRNHPEKFSANLTLLKIVAGQTLIHSLPEMERRDQSDRSHLGWLLLSAHLFMKCGNVDTRIPKTTTAISWLSKGDI
jgi:hypothetical protein